MTIKTKSPEVRWAALRERLQHATLAVQVASSREQERKHEIFRQRAAHLAAPRSPAESGRKIVQTLVFSLGEQRFGIPLCHVGQVYPAPILTFVPRAPAWVLGIASFESQIRSVIDLAALLKLSASRVSDQASVLLVRCSAETVAVRVDKVEEIQKVDFDDLAAPDQQSILSQTRMVRGLTQEHLAILSVETLIALTASPNGAPS